MAWALIGGGNHQVLAAKKYAMTAVKIQTTGASSIDSALLYVVPVPSTALEGGTKTITLDDGRATPFITIVDCDLRRCHATLRTRCGSPSAGGMRPRSA